jgi:hypothetical protein
MYKVGTTILTATMLAITFTVKFQSSNDNNIGLISLTIIKMKIKFQCVSKQPSLVKIVVVKIHVSLFAEI